MQKETEALVQKNPHLEKAIRDIRIAKAQLIKDASGVDGSIRNLIEDVHGAIVSEDSAKIEQAVDALERYLHQVEEWISSLQLDLSDLEDYKKDLQGIRNIIALAGTAEGFILYFHAAQQTKFNDYKPRDNQYVRATRNLKNPELLRKNMNIRITNGADQRQIMREKNGEANFLPIIYGRVRKRESRSEVYHEEVTQGFFRKKVQVPRQRKVYSMKEPTLGEITIHSESPDNDAYFIQFWPPPYVSTPRQRNGCDITAIGSYGWMGHVIKLLFNHPEYYKHILESIIPPKQNPNVNKYFIEKLDIDALIFFQDSMQSINLANMKKEGTVAWLQK